MVMLGYFLAKYGEKSQAGTNLPPKELAGESFAKILQSFYPQLGGVRTLRTFIGSMNPTVTYFRNPKNMEDWLRKHRDKNPWIEQSRDQLWSELQRLRGTRVMQVVSRKASQDTPSGKSRLTLEVEVEQNLAEAQGEFEPHDTEDARKRTFRRIALRLGQPKFRKRLLAAYGNKCCMTGTTATEVLEAAHIQAYSKLGTNSVTNGLLLRSDLHVLFDLLIVSVDPASHTIYCSRSIRSVPPYDTLHGKKIRRPHREIHRPNVMALTRHFQMTCAE
jgi:hypothetical protein